MEETDRETAPVGPDPERDVALWDGLVAGLLAGATVAVFFFVVDALQAEPFRTPRFLATVLFNAGEAGAGAGLVTVFTVLHFAAFAVLGVGAVVLCRWARLPYNVLLGGVYGLFVATLLFYLSLVLSGARVLQAPGWPSVLAGNLLAGLALGAYLHARSSVPGLIGVRNQLRLHPTLREGFVAGAIGAVSVAVWFLLVDGVTGDPFFTPGALGSALFLGARSPEAVEVTARTVLGYSVVHVAAFLVFGVVASGLVAQAEKFPPFVFALLLLFVVFEVAFVGLAALLGAWLLEELAWWSVLAGNLLAASGMGAYLWKAHPALQEEIRAGAVWGVERGGP